jgi:hypothetical protein
MALFKQRILTRLHANGRAHFTLKEAKIFASMLETFPKRDRDSRITYRLLLSDRPLLSPIQHS